MLYVPFCSWLVKCRFFNFLSSLWFSFYCRHSMDLSLRPRRPVSPLQSLKNSKMQSIYIQYLMNESPGHSAKDCKLVKRIGINITLLKVCLTIPLALYTLSSLVAAVARRRYCFHVQVSVMPCREKYISFI